MDLSTAGRVILVLNKAVDVVSADWRATLFRLDLSATPEMIMIMSVGN